MRKYRVDFAHHAALWEHGFDDLPSAYDKINEIRFECERDNDPYEYWLRWTADDTVLAFGTGRVDLIQKDLRFKAVESLTELDRDARV